MTTETGWLTPDEASARFGSLTTGGVVKTHLEFAVDGGVWKPSFGEPIGMGFGFGDLIGYKFHSTRSGTKLWAGYVTMDIGAAAEFELGVVYWLEQKETDLMRPMFRRRAKVVSICQEPGGVVTVGFTEVPDPPTWSQQTDPESRQLAGL